MYSPSSFNSHHKLSITPSSTTTKESSYYNGIDSINSYPTEFPIETPTKIKKINLDEFTPIKQVRNKISKERRNDVCKPIPFNHNFDPDWRNPNYDDEKDQTDNNIFNNKIELKIDENIIKECKNILSDINLYKDYEGNISILFINKSFETIPMDKSYFFQNLDSLKIDSDSNPISDVNLVYYAGKVVLFDCRINEYSEFTCRYTFIINQEKIYLQKIEILNN